MPHRNRGALRGLSLAAVVLAGCSTGSPAPVDDAGALDGAAADGGDSGAGASGARTLASCSTSIADDAPAFFKSYFRCVTITSTTDATTITTDALPPHPSNYYGPTSPNYEPFDTSRGPTYRANPNLLTATRASITIPRTPVARGVTITPALIDGVVGSAAEEYPLGAVGVALDSVPLFNPLARPGDDIEEEKFTFDRYNAHPTGTGAYHYHTTSIGPLEILSSLGIAGVELYGIMCDGTVVLGCTELDASSPDFSALDAQGGHISDVKDGQGTVHFASRYHTHVCPSNAAGRRFTPEIQFYSTCTR